MEPRCGTPMPNTNNSNNQMMTTTTTTNSTHDKQRSDSSRYNVPSLRVNNSVPMNMSSNNNNNGRHVSMNQRPPLLPNYVPEQVPPGLSQQPPPPPSMYSEASAAALGFFPQYSEQYTSPQQASQMIYANPMQPQMPPQYYLEQPRLDFLYPINMQQTYASEGANMMMSQSSYNGSEYGGSPPNPNGAFPPHMVHGMQQMSVDQFRMMQSTPELYGLSSFYGMPYVSGQYLYPEPCQCTSCLYARDPQQQQQAPQLNYKPVTTASSTSNRYNNHNNNTGNMSSSGNYHRRSNRPSDDAVEKARKVGDSLGVQLTYNLVSEKMVSNIKQQQWHHNNNNNGQQQQQQPPQQVKRIDVLCQVVDSDRNVLYNRVSFGRSFFHARTYAAQLAIKFMEQELATRGAIGPFIGPGGDHLSHSNIANASTGTPEKDELSSLPSQSPHSVISHNSSAIEELASNLATAAIIEDDDTSPVEEEVSSNEQLIKSETNASLNSLLSDPTVSAVSSTTAGMPLSSPGNDKEKIKEMTFSKSTPTSITSSVNDPLLAKSLVVATQAEPPAKLTEMSMHDDSIEVDLSGLKPQDLIELNQMAKLTNAKFDFTHMGTVISRSKGPEQRPADYNIGCRVYFYGTLVQRTKGSGSDKEYAVNAAARKATHFLECRYYFPDKFVKVIDAIIAGKEGGPLVKHDYGSVHKTPLEVLTMYTNRMRYRQSWKIIENPNDCKSITVCLRITLNNWSKDGVNKFSEKGKREAEAELKVKVCQKALQFYLRNHWFHDVIDRELPTNRVQPQQSGSIGPSSGGNSTEIRRHYSQHNHHHHQHNNNRSSGPRNT